VSAIINATEQICSLIVPAIVDWIVFGPAAFLGRYASDHHGGVNAQANGGAALLLVSSIIDARQ
jgi:hypothetical protein